MLTMMVEIAGGIVLAVFILALIGILIAARELVCDAFARVFAFCGFAVVVLILGYGACTFVWGIVDIVRSI